MATIKDIKDGLEAAVLASSFFQQFVADDLDTINEDSKNSYPYLLWSPTTSTDGTPRKGGSTSVFAMDLYACNLQFQGDGPERSTRFDKWDAMETELRLLLDTLLPSTMYVNSTPLVLEYGHSQHNDDVLVVKATLEIVIFTC